AVLFCHNGSGRRSPLGAWLCGSGLWRGLHAARIGFRLLRMAPVRCRITACNAGSRPQAVSFLAALPVRTVCRAARRNPCREGAGCFGSALMDKAVQKPVDSELELVVPTEQQKKAQRNRSWGLAIALALFVLLVYVGTIAKLGANLLVRPL